MSPDPLQINPVAGYNRKQLSNPNIKVISTGTNHRRAVIVPKSPGLKKTPERKATQISVKENQRLAYPIKGPRQRADSRQTPRLRRKAHVKKSSLEEQDETKVLPSSPVAASPDSVYPPTAKVDYFSFSPETPGTKTSLQRYPSSIFEDYFDEPSSAIESPVHTVEALGTLRRRSSSFHGDEHKIWGEFWTEKMEVHVDENEEKPGLHRTTTRQVAELIKNRRRQAKDFRMNTMASFVEVDEE